MQVSEYSGDIPAPGDVTEQNVETGALDRVKMRRVVLGPGAVWEPVLTVRPKQTQILLFTEGSGYVAAGGRAFNIDGPARFVPDFDREEVTVRAGEKGLSLIEIVADQNPEDSAQINKSHMVFPNFRPLSEAWECRMGSIRPDSNLSAFILIENRKLGANNMGYFRSTKTGASYTEPDTLKVYDHFVIALPGADFTVKAGTQVCDVKENSVVFIPHGTPFSFSCGEEGRINHVWSSLNRAYDE